MSSGIVDSYKEFFGQPPVAVAQAPGRLEILGNHTDYNEGLVLSAAVGQTTEFAIAKSDGRNCRIHNFGDNSDIEFNLDEIDEPVPGDWSNYVKGVIVELRKRGVEIEGFDAGILGKVPLSAGMSSSAALEMSAAFAFKALFEIDLPKTEWARIGQAVENEYIGVQTGLLDQFSSLFGQENSLIYCDFRTVEVLKTVSIPEGYMLVVANSLVKHDLVDSDYNVRRESCEQVVANWQKKYPDIKALRDVTPEMLDEGKELLDHQDYLRAKHIVGENDRVIRGVELLEKGEIEGFGKLLFESHLSSRDYFENSCPELDCLVELAGSIPGCVGARLSGGGFGGISIHLVKTEEADTYCERLQSAYKLQTGKETETIKCSIGAGASVK